jgi:rhodanese-related sulfurtransferase
MKTAMDFVTAAKARITEIDVPQCLAELANAELVLDVREPDEYSQGHLPGAVNVPRGLLEFKLSADTTLSRRDLQVLLYCKTGGRAALSAATLQDMGYLHVKSVAGGFDAWANAGLPVACPAPINFG